MAGQTELIKAAVKEALHEAGLPDRGRLDALESIVIKLNSLVTGNGNPESGMVLKVDRSAQAIEDLKEATKKRSDREWMIFGGMILLIATNLVQIAF